VIASGLPVGAIVLAGGAARRFGGVDKMALELAGVAVLDRVLGELPARCEIVVVGPERTVSRAVRFVSEDPAGGGPVAALAAGLDAIAAASTYLLAGDLPFLTRAVLETLAAAVEDHDGAMAVDASGRDQPLLSCWKVSRVRAALPREPSGVGLSRTLGILDIARAPLPGHPPAWWDCDTPAAWAQAQQWAADRERNPET
jgi:molybdopterin-guanine dinucleotide biosynthesis protein A